MALTVCAMEVSTLKKVIVKAACITKESEAKGCVLPDTSFTFFLTKGGFG